MASGKGGKRKGFKPVGAQASASNSSARLKGRAAAGQSGGTARVREWRFLVTAGAIVVGALLLRLYRIGAEELWLDEASSWSAATMPRMTGSLAIRNNPPLYYLLLRASVVVAGQSEAGLRMLSAVAGTLFVAAVIWTGREIFDSRVGLWSGAVAAVAPIHICYSQEARAYALLTLALALTYATLWRALRANTWRWWALASASAVVALYSHYLAVLALLPTAYLVMAWPGPRRWRRYTAALLGSGLLFLPWVVWSFLLTPHSFAGIAWLETVRERTPPWLAIPLSLEVFGIGAQAGLLPIQLRRFDALTFPGPFRLLGLVLLALLGLWVAVP